MMGKDGKKLSARERLELLFDKDSFIELDAGVVTRCESFGMKEKQTAGDGVIGGYGLVGGQVVYAYAQDPEVMGGSLGEAHAGKIIKLMNHGIQADAPIVGLIDSGGARIQEGVDALSGYGRIFYLNTQASGRVLQISAIMGACAGGAVYSPALTDFILMVKDGGKMFVTGPDVVKSVTGEQISAEALGGSALHGRTSGVVHFVEETEQECITRIRALISFFYSGLEPQGGASIKPEDGEWLRDCLPKNPRQTYDMYKVIAGLVDGGVYIDYMKDYALNMVTCFAWIGGRPVGIVANQPLVLAGCIDINASDKAARFVRTCDAFGIPIISLADVPGFLPGVSQEHDGIIRHGAKMLYAYGEATVPRITIILRKAYGGAYLAMGCKELGTDFVYAWPDAEIAVMGAEGAANIIFRKEPPGDKAEKIAGYIREFANPDKAAARGIVDRVIKPEETRYLICKSLEALKGKKLEHNHKKHGNIPL